MNRGLDALGGIDDETTESVGDFKNVSHSTNYDLLSEEAVIKRHYSMSKPIIDILENIALSDNVAHADVVRAAVWLIAKAGNEVRKDAYEATKVVKKKAGRKPKK